MELRCNKPAKVMKLAPSSSSCFITNLPNPILMEILCRLPIKTLTASKSVCKSWLNLSRDPYFTKLQAKAPTEVFLQLYDDKDTIKLRTGNLHCLNNVDPLDVKLNTLFELPKFSVGPNNTLDYGTVTGEFNFSNSCNGLLCYHGGESNRFVVVWNPCTNEFITLPALERYDVGNICCGYGLGFSRKTNKYKLLRLVFPASKWNVVADILSIERGCSWKSLGPCPRDVCLAFDQCSSRYRIRMQGTFLHGTLHWLSYSSSVYSSESDIAIPTFDFEDDRFGRVPLPSSFGKNYWNTGSRVGELLGCLFITDYSREVVNIWLMKEYGVQDSWTKIYSFPAIVKYESVNEHCLEPVTCMDNGEILFVYNTYGYTSLLSYNRVQDFRRIGSGRGSLIVITYRPSLVLLKDSMLGYEVHVSALKDREMSTTPGRWTLTKSDLGSVRDWQALQGLEPFRFQRKPIKGNYSRANKRRK